MVKTNNQIEGENDGFIIRADDEVGYSKSSYHVLPIANKSLEIFAEFVVMSYLCWQ